MVASKQIEFEANGRAYRAKRLDAVTQLILNLKLTPLLAHADPILKAMKSRADALNAAAESVARGEQLPDIPEMSLETLEPIAIALSRMPEDVQRSILRTLLSSVFRVEGPGVVPIWDHKNDQVVPDIGGMEMVVIAWRVFEENFGNFFGGTGLTSRLA